MSMSTFAAKIGTTLIALCLAVGFAGTASASPADGCYSGDGHSWHN
jgi:hypothetical protein